MGRSVIKLEVLFPHAEDAAKETVIATVECVIVMEDEPAIRALLSKRAAGGQRSWGRRRLGNTADERAA
jgi:hypothetical protein